MGIQDIRDALVVRERSTTMMSDPDGNIPRGNTQGFGVYFADTRHLSTYSLSLDGLEPVVLLSTAEAGHAMEQVMTNPTFLTPEGRPVLRGSTEIRRQRNVADVIEERLLITNFNPMPVTMYLQYEFDADFADIFDVRGYERDKPGSAGPPAVRSRSIEYSYTGIDDQVRKTRIEFDRKPERIDATSARFRIDLDGRGAAALRIRISLNDRGRRAPALNRFSVVEQQYRKWNDANTQFFADNEFFNSVMARSMNDLRMLWTTSDDGSTFMAAGTPWFDALFGRDSCIVALQTLAFRPEIARACLRVLARNQGGSLDAHRDEEPGKILHELRWDELSRGGELPYSPYYGSIDSTPLFLLLAAEYYAWTADTRFIRELLPAIRAAANWMEVFGDALKNGYLSYEKRSAKGLVNQGWKDSWDAVVHADGSLARPPIALAEVQGYAYAARTRLADVLDRVGDGELAQRMRRQARAMYERFDSDFWIAGQGFYAMALDGEGRQVESASTNPAHCMWTGLVQPRRAPDVTTRLLSNELFSGWGLRTLTASSPRFNPLGYHVGTIWPHDNAIAAMGLKMYGFEDELNEVATALFDAAVSFPYFRLPELFGGQSRSAHNAPVPYPVACVPQAWAAGAFPLIAQAILGIKAEAPEGRLRVVHPVLPYWLNSVRVRGLRVGNGTVSLAYRREGSHTRVEVEETTGGIDVVLSQGWPA